MPANWRSYLVVLAALPPLVPLPVGADTGKPPANVRESGAKCDGVHDDAAAFQAAIDTADPAKGGSGTILIPPSPRPCIIGAPLVLHSGETITAKPGTATIAPKAPYPDLNRNPLIAVVKDVANVTLRGIIIDGAADTVGTSNALIVVYGADHVLFDHVTVQNSRGTSITFSGGPRGVTNSGVENSTFHNIGSYYLRSGDKKNDRKQTVVWCCGQQGAGGSWNNQHNFVKSSAFGENGFDNLSITQQNWFTASDNTFDGSHNGANIYCSHNDHIRIINNKTRAAAGNGIDCFINTDLTITGNQSSENGAAGIQVAETHCGLIAHNVTMNNFQSSIQSWSAQHPGTPASVHRGGITIGGEKSDKLGTEGLTVAGNVSGDNQPRPTQAFGIQVRDTATIRSLTVSSDNNLAGNTQGPYGQQLRGPSAAATATCRLWNGAE